MFARLKAEHCPVFFIRQPVAFAAGDRRCFFAPSLRASITGSASNDSSMTFHFSPNNQNSERVGRGLGERNGVLGPRGEYSTENCFSLSRFRV